MPPLGRYGLGKINSMLRPAGTLLFDQPWAKHSGRDGLDMLEDLAGSDLSIDDGPTDAGTHPICWPCRRSRRCQERAGSPIHWSCCRESWSGPCMGLAGGAGSRKGAGFSPTGSQPPSLGCSVGGSPAAPPAVLQQACHPPASPAAGPELEGGEQDTLSRSEPCPQETHNWTTC